jgi:hypothetical protein
MKKFLFFLILIGGFGIVNVAHGIVATGTSAGFVTTAPTADPTGTASPVDTYSTAGKFVAPADATAINSMGWWNDNATEAANFDIGIYSHVAGTNLPGTLLASTTVAKGTTSGWKTANVSTTITGGTTYWLAVQFDDTATATNIDYSAITGSRRSYMSSQTALAATWTSGGVADGILLSIYAVYTTSTPAIPVATPRFWLQGLINFFGSVWFH